MLSKAVAVSCENDAWSIEKYLFVSHSSHMGEIETEVVSSGNIAHITPLTLLGFLTINF